MKTYLLRNVGKGQRQFHQVQAGFLLAGFLLSHGQMTTGKSAMILLGSRVRTEGVLIKGDPSHPVDFSSSLFRGFLVDELHDTRFIQLGWRVTGPLSVASAWIWSNRRTLFLRGVFCYIRTMFGLRWNPTIVLERPPFPPHEHVASFAFQDFFYPK